MALLLLAGALETAEYRVMDMRFRVLTRTAADDLVLVAIDPASLRELERWPWPRSHHAALVEKLIDAGVERIAFDVDFSSASVTEHDLAFERALAAAGDKVVLAAFQQIAVDPGEERRLVRTEPLATLRQHARIASINVRPATDSVVREMTTAVPWSSGSLPSLAALLAGRSGPEPRSFYVDFGYKPDSVSRVSYADVLAGRVDRALLENRRVIVGATAIELGDQVPVPVYRSLPGPLLQALAYHTLRDRPLHRLGVLPVLAVTALCALLLGRWFATWSWRAGLALLVISSCGYFAVSIAAQAAAALLIDIVPLVLMMLMSFAVEQILRIDRQSLMLMLQGIEIRRKDALMSHVVAHSFDGILTADETGMVESLNPAAERMFGRSDALAGQPLRALLPELHLAANAASGPAAETRGHGAQGMFPAEVSWNRIDAGGRRLFTIFVRDVTERRMQEDSLRHQANHDALTGLPNRHLLFNHIRRGLAQAARSRRTLALLLFDLDRFKEINDTLGHHVGDMVLQAIGPRLTTAVGESGMVARLGGDEFAILLPDPRSLHATMALSERLLRCLRTPFEIGSVTLEVGASIGIAIYPDHGASASDLLQRADIAMYAAKQRLRRLAVYDAESDRHSVRELTLSGSLRRAIENGQLELYYQPKVDIASGTVVGAEGLVRWHHDEHGFVRPDEFISLAEQTGLIHPLTLWVMDTAAAQCARWRAQGHSLGVAINLSPRTLQDTGLVDRVVSSIHRHRISPDWMTLEITESALMSEPKRALAAIDGLRGAGVRLSIDDFGTGFSSLAYLKQLPATELKLDQSFVRDLGSDDASMRIVRSTIELAHGFGMAVVAEGIENAAAANLLRMLSCDVGQGFLYSRPLTASDFDAWLAGASEHAASEPRAARG